MRLKTRLYPGPSKAILASSQYKWWVYLAVATGLFITVMDQSGVNIAVPAIADDFNLDIPTVQWTLLAYILTTSIMFMPVGQLADLVGHKQVYLTGLLIYLIGAAVGGAAPVFPVILISKVIQGVGSGGIQANSMAIITSAFPQHERGKAIGLYTTIVGSGLITGPIFGGLLVNWLGWRAVFFANLPFSLLAIFLALAIVKETAPASGPGERRGKFDWAGAAFSSGALIGSLLGMSNGHRFGWDSPAIIACFSLASVLFVVFIWWELRTTGPMLDMGFFRNRVFSLGVSARFLNFLGGSSIFFLMPFYIINGLGYSPDKAGLMLVPGALAMAVMGPVSGRISDKVGPRWTMTIGQVISAGALFTLSQLDVDSSPVYVVIGLLLSGIGMGTFNAANSMAVLTSQGQERFGIVAAFLNLVRTSANVSGITLATTVVTVTMGSLGYDPTLAAVSEVGGEGVKGAFVSGLNKAFLVGGGILVLATVISSLQRSARKESSSIEALDSRPPQKAPKGMEKAK